MAKPKQAALQIAGTRIAKINITNDFVALPPNIECSLELDYDVGEITTLTESKIVSADIEGYTATAILTVSVGCARGEQSMHVELSTEACFLYCGTDKTEFDRLLRLNGAATLYSIARGQIISITSQCTNGGAIIIPLLNFSEVGSLTPKEK